MTIERSERQVVPRLKIKEERFAIDVTELDDDPSRIEVIVRTKEGHAYLTMTRTDLERIADALKDFVLA